MNIVLLVLSIVIYLSYGIPNFLYILFSMLISFITAKHIKNNKKLLILTIAINAAILVFVKFLPYTKLDIYAPLGISYYTLQVISYLVDIYKEKYEYEEKFMDFALYIMYIPHLFIGPISRYDDMKKELKVKRRLSFDNFYNGGMRILWGLLKKLVIARKNINNYNNYYRKCRSV